MLAQALAASLKFIPTPASAPFIFAPTSTPAQSTPTPTPQLFSIQNKLLENQMALWQKIASIDICLTEVQINMEVQMGDVISMLGRIFATIRADKTTTLE